MSDENQRDDLRKFHWALTSKGIATAYPSVVSSAKWAQFKSGYDNPTASKKRLKEWKRFEDSRNEPAVLRKLNELTDRVGDGCRTSAEDLAYFVQTLMEAGDEFTDFVQAVNENRLNRMNKNVVSEIVQALANFLERNGKLPTREELNEEAQLISTICRREITSKAWSDAYPLGSPATFSMPLDRKLDLFFKGRLFYKLEILSDTKSVAVYTTEEVNAEGDGLRWGKTSTFSGVLKRAGMLAL